VTDAPTLGSRDLLAIREAMCAGWAGYQRELADLRATATTPEAFSPPDLALQISRCSTVFLTLLGGRVEQMTSAAGDDLVVAGGRKVL